MESPAFADTTVFCRPHQLAEAAIALSCLSRGRLVPLFVLEQPCVSRQQYAELYAAFDAARRQSMDNVYAARFGPGGELPAKAKIVDDVRAHGAARVKLHAPRSWLRHNLRVKDLLSRIDCRRAVFLFEPFAEDLHLWEMGEEDPNLPSLDPAERIPMLPAHCEIVTLVVDDGSPPPADGTRRTFESLTALTDLALDLVRGRGPAGKEIAFDPRDVAGTLLALHEALATEGYLRTGCHSDSSESSSWHLAGPQDSCESILIEPNPTAASAVGVLLAHHRRAQLVITPPVDFSRVEAAVQSFAKQKEETARTIRAITGHAAVRDALRRLSTSEQETVLQFTGQTGLPGTIDASELKTWDIIDRVRKYLLQDWRTQALEDIEQAVSGPLPAELVAAVGERPLTAFTSGVPYTFVRKGESDWSRKRIGHVATDASLLVFNSLCLEAPPPEKPLFAAIFDPGFFATSETEDVLAALKRTRMCPVVFSGESASALSLQGVSALPLELIFLNTHGSHSAVELAEGSWERTDLVQQLGLPSGPLVFNNSCTSWRGVGREFVRIGARGFVGTLWPVHAGSAAVFGADVMVNLVGGKSISEAIRDTKVDRETNLAYIYVGTASDQFVRLAPEGLRSSEDSLRIAACILELLRSSRMFSSDVARPWRTLRIFIELADSMLAAVDRNRVDPAALADAYASYVSVLGLHGARLAIPLQAVDAMVDDIMRLLKVTSLEAAEVDRRRVCVHLARADFRKAKGQLQGALDDISAAGVVDDDQLPALDALMLSELHQGLGDYKNAKRLALHVLNAAASTQQQKMIARGRLARLEKRFGDKAAFHEHAMQGLTLATECRDHREEIHFQIDVAVALIRLGDTASAIASAQKAQVMARRCSELSAYLSASGALAMAQLAAGEIEQARLSASRGLQVSASAGDLYEEASFLLTLSTIEEKAGRLEAAILQALEGFQKAVECGHLEMAMQTHHRILTMAVRLEDWRYITAACQSYLRTQPLFTSHLRMSRMVWFLQELCRAIFVGRARDARACLTMLYGLSNELLSEHGGDADVDLHAARKVAVVLLAWIDRRAEVPQLAAQLDEWMSGFGFDWSTFVAQSPPSD